MVAADERAELMRILMINKFLYPNGGAEAYLLQLGNHLQSQGHEVQYFGMDHKDRCVGNAVDAYTSCMDFHGGFSLSKLGYPLKTIYSVEARSKLRRVLKDFNPQVVHINNFHYQLTPSIIVEISRWRKEGHPCRIILTAHDYQLVCPNHLLRNPVTGQLCDKCLGGSYIHCAKGRCIHGSWAKSLIGTAGAVFWKRRGVYRSVDAVICCSAFIKAKIDSDPLLAGKTVLLRSFVEKKPWKDTEKKDYALYFGRFSPEKGIGTLLKVLKELPEIRFVFAGAGPMEKEISGNPNIRNVGFQRGEALEGLIREARFSVYPSEWYENCPFSVMESQTYGTPVLAADIGGIPELLKDGSTGELFASGSAAELKRKLKRLWHGRELTDRYSQNCRDAGFDDLEVYTQKLMPIYMG